jgi:hypothetical protein
MSESIGIYGLVLFFLGEKSVDLCLLCSVAAVAIIAYGPKKDAMIGLIEAHDGGSFTQNDPSEKNVYENKNLKRRRKVASLIVLLASAIVLLDMFFCDFLPRSTFSKLLPYIVVISAIVSTVCLYRSVSFRIRNPDVIRRNPLLKNKSVRILYCAVCSLMLAWTVCGGFLPWLYTGITGSEGDILVAVTGWNVGGAKSGCSKPYVNNQILFSPARGMCVDSTEWKKYTCGTVLRLTGKISLLGINVRQMEIVSKTQHYSR